MVTAVPSRARPIGVVSPASGTVNVWQAAALRGRPPIAEPRRIRCPGTAGSPPRRGLPHHDIHEETPLPGFSDLGLSNGVLAAIEALGFDQPMPVQAET